jgi:phage terminase large subunit-like protein
MLEDQMCEWNPADASADSPDRMDALVWGVTELVVADNNTGILDFYREQAQALRAQQQTGA